MNYKKWLIEDLQELETLRFACESMRKDLGSIDAEISAIEAGGKDAEREEWLLDARARWMDISENLKATEMHVANMDRLLGQLPEDERTAVRCLYVDKQAGGLFEAMEQLHCEKTQVYRIKDRAIMRLARMRFGKGVRE